ncbi:MAG: restriction endonuclease subunit S [Spirochaetales bacterium]|nr:restriction endonuclease subunit S [Spirochaetales bacterium]
MREDWCECKLFDIGTIFSGGTPKTSIKEYWGNEIAWITPADLSNYSSKLIEKGRKSITKLGLIKSSAKLMPKGSILFSSRAPIGYTVIAKNELCTNQGFKSIFPHEHILSDFIYYYLKASKNLATKNASGTTFPEISATKFGELPFPLAPLPEQRAIVAKIEQLFSELDNGIANLKAVKEKLEIYRQAVLKKAFEGELTDIDKITWLSLSEVCHNVEYGTSAKSKKAGKIPVLRMGNIQNGRFDWTDLVYTSDPIEIEKYKLEKEDVLFNRTNSPELVGKTAIYKGEHPAIFAGYLIRVNYKKDEVNGDYLNYFLNCHIAKKYGNEVKSFGVNQSNINGTKLKQYPFPYTSIKNQKAIIQEIESRLSVCDKIRQTVDEALSKSEALRQSILKKAFEGKLLSKQELKACKAEPDWEPAEKLLERIKLEKTGTKK